MRYRDLMTKVTEPSVKGKYYSVGPRIGATRFSDVFVGCDIEDKDETPVAIKRFAHEEPLANVLAANNEVSLLKRCGRSVHVVDCLDYRVENKDTYIVMEHVPTNLQRNPKVLRSEELLFLALQYIKQISQLLADLRDAAVIHSDLKPANMGIKDGLIKALDFGLAKDFGLALYEDDVRAYRVKNVPSYNPPEMRETPDEEFPNEALVTPTCDTYSAGVVLSHLLIGQQAKSEKVLAKKVKREHELVLPRSVRKLYARMTHPKALRRPHPEELRAMAWEADKDLTVVCLAKAIIEHDQSTVLDVVKPQIDYFGESASASVLC